MFTLKKSWKPKLALFARRTKAKKVLRPPLNTAGPICSRVEIARPERKGSTVDNTT